MFNQRSTFHLAVLGAISCAIAAVIDVAVFVGGLVVLRAQMWPADAWPFISLVAVNMLTTLGPPAAALGAIFGFQVALLAGPAPFGFGHRGALPVGLIAALTALVAARLAGPALMPLVLGLALVEGAAVLGTLMVVGLIPER